MSTRGKEKSRVAGLRLGKILLWCAAVCCSVLRCVVVCCSVLPCVAAGCSVLQGVAVCRSVLRCVAGRCSMLKCVAVCCIVLQGIPIGKFVLMAEEESEKKIGKRVVQHVSRCRIQCRHIVACSNVARRVTLRWVGLRWESCSAPRRVAACRGTPSGDTTAPPQEKAWLTRL